MMRSRKARPAATSAGPRRADAVRELAALANLGPRSAEALVAAGISSLKQLRALGAVAAYSQARKSGANVTLNLLWALEGALTGLPWQTVAKEHRTSLLLALDTHENGT
jgi:DNA transformation protein and related proteins